MIAAPAVSPRRRLGAGPTRFAVAVALTGLAAGLAGTALTLLLHAVQHAAFGYTEDTFLIGVQHADALRRVLALTGGGMLAGAGWWTHRRANHASVSVTHALTTPAPHLPMLATVSDAALQILAVGAGASLGREGAPRQAGAALGGAIAARLHLTAEQRRILLAAGAGAGLAAVYNVPLSGAAFTLEILLGTLAPAAVTAAILTSAIATAVAWPVLGTHPTYQLSTPPLTLGVLAAALVLGPLAGGLGLLFRLVMTAARTRAPAGWRAALAMPVAFAALGATAIAFPQLLGNGKSLAQLALTGSLGLGLAAVLALLKPAATAVCLGSGAIGGLLTPSFATGATVGMLLGELWSRILPGSAPAAYALIGAAALLSVTQRAPLTAAILTVEFTHAGPRILPAILVGVAGSRLVEQLVTRRTAHRKSGNGRFTRDVRRPQPRPPNAGPARLHRTSSPE